MDAMDGASSADNGSGADAVAVASPPIAGLAAASAGAGVVTNTSSEMAPTPVAVAGNASGTARTGSEGPQAEAEEVQKKQAVAAVDTKCDDDKEGSPAVDVPPPAVVRDGADGEVQKGSFSVKAGAATSTASHEESASTPIAGAAETPAVEDVNNAGGACKVCGFEPCYHLYLCIAWSRLEFFSIVPSHSHIYPSPLDIICIYYVCADIEFQERSR